MTDTLITPSVDQIDAILLWSNCLGNEAVHNYLAKPTTAVAIYNRNALIAAGPSPLPLNDVPPENVVAVFSRVDQGQSLSDALSATFGLSTQFTRQLWKLLVNKSENRVPPRVLRDMFRPLPESGFGHVLDASHVEWPSYPADWYHLHNAYRFLHSAYSTDHSPPLPTYFRGVANALKSLFDTHQSWSACSQAAKDMHDKSKEVHVRLERLLVDLYITLPDLYDLDRKLVVNGAVIGAVLHSLSPARFRHFTKTINRIGPAMISAAYSDALAWDLRSPPDLPSELHGLIKVTPVCGVGHLRTLGRDMNSCIADFADHCVRGIVAVYVIDDLAPDDNLNYGRSVVAIRNDGSFEHKRAHNKEPSSLHCDVVVALVSSFASRAITKSLQFDMPKVDSRVVGWHTQSGNNRAVIGRRLGRLTADLRAAFPHRYHDQKKLFDAVTSLSPELAQPNVRQISGRVVTREPRNATNG